jgi:hypothetical protein
MCVIVLTYYYHKYIQIKVTYANIIRRVDNVKNAIESLMQMSAYKLTAIPALNKNSKCVQVSEQYKYAMPQKKEKKRWNKENSQSNVLDIS